MTPRTGLFTNSSVTFVTLFFMNLIFFTFGNGVLFDRLHGYHVTSSDMRTVPCPGSTCSITFCALVCMRSVCVGVSFRSAENTCYLHRKPINSAEVTFDASSDWEYIQRRTNFVWYDEWILVFRATSRIGQSTNDTWFTPGRYDDSPAIRRDVPIGCSSVNGSHHCDRHFKSKIVDDWMTYIFEEVKVVLYENGLPMESATFNGNGPDNKNWFSQSELISSSWTDMIRSANKTFFITDDDVSFVRHWYIGNSDSGCNVVEDVGWMVVLDSNVSVCDWESDVKSGFPVFLYAANHQITRWHSRDFRQADVMAVFVKFPW